MHPLQDMVPQGPDHSIKKEAHHHREASILLQGGAQQVEWEVVVEDQDLTTIEVDLARVGVALGGHIQDLGVVVEPEGVEIMIIVSEAEEHSVLVAFL